MKGYAATIKQLKELKKVACEQQSEQALAEIMEMEKAVRAIHKDDVARKKFRSTEKIMMWGHQMSIPNSCHHCGTTKITLHFDPVFMHFYIDCRNCKTKAYFVLCQERCKIGDIHV